MISSISKNMFLVALFVCSQSAVAAKAVRVEPKQALAVHEGVYVVVSAEPSDEDDNLCQLKAEHTVKWFGQAESPVLSFGNARTYSDFNSGLKADSIAGDKQHCKFTHSTQAESNRLIDDSFSNCDNENTTTHTEIVFRSDKTQDKKSDKTAAKSATIEYTSTMKVSRKGKAVSVTSKCVLRKLEISPKQPKHK